MAENFLTRVVDWLREGYPAGIPAKDTIPILALLRRRLTDEEVSQVVDELLAQGMLTPDSTDIAAQISKVTDAPPAGEDVLRVAEQLAFRGFPPHDPVLIDGIISGVEQASSVAGTVDADEAASRTSDVDAGVAEPPARP